MRKAPFSISFKHQGVSRYLQRFSDNDGVICASEDLNMFGWNPAGRFCLVTVHGDDVGLLISMLEDTLDLGTQF